jgi:uncharacterized protein YbcI
LTQWAKPDRTDVEATIAAELMRVQRESYGAGADRIDVHLDGDTVLAVIDVELTPAERTLLGAGNADAVKTTREAFQQAIAPTFSAIVERATGRRVVGFISAMNIEPLFAIEFFRLAPDAQ